MSIWNITNPECSGGFHSKTKVRKTLCKDSGNMRGIRRRRRERMRREEWNWGISLKPLNEQQNRNFKD